MDVEGWLRTIGLERYAAAFQENDVDASVLTSLTADDLRDLGVNSIGHRRRLMDGIAALAAAGPVSVAPPPLGMPLATAPTVAEAERRQLTVMFVDLADSTALSARLDPEDMQGVIRAYQNAVAGEIARVEGHVAKFMGDGVLAYFGWPRAHEDEAERAARAGLAIAAAVSRLTGGGTPLVCRVGIATGLMVVGDLIGEGAAQEQTVVGDTPNLAARLQGIARPGQVVVADATRRLIAGAFDLADLGPQIVKGLGEPVNAFVVTAERSLESRYAARAAVDPGGPNAPLFGRDSELGVMRDRWAAACAGQGQLILLSGEAGIGKSRIAQGLIESIPEAHVRIVWQCSPYHAETTLHPAIQQISRAAGFAPGEDEAARRARLDALLARTGVGSEATALLTALVGLAPLLAMAPAQARVRTLEALIDWLEAMAQKGPVLWVIEDAHWIDPTTLELVDLALERVAQTSVLVLVTARPTFQHGFGGHPIVTRLSLNRLGREAVAEIVARITGGKSLPAALMEEIAARTDGVPLYIEEMTKAVLESGALRETAEAWVLDGPFNRLAIPTSLHDSLMARLDRLQPVKEVAQTAAVIGRAFDHATLTALSPLPEPALAEAINKLVAAELVFRRGVAPEASYLFKHALVRDAAYESLLRSKRRALHSRLVGVLESGGAGPELLAQHAQAGGETARAVTWWRAAAQAAVERAAFNEAVAHLDAAEALLPGLNDDKLRRNEAAGIAVGRALASLVQHGYADPRTEALYADALTLARAGDDSRVLLSAVYGVWAVHHVAEAPEPARAVAEQMLDDAMHRSNSDLEMMGNRSLGVSLTMAGRFEETLPYYARTAALYDTDRHRPLAASIGIDPLLGINCYRAIAELVLGYPERALSLIASAQEISGRTDSVNTKIYLLFHASAVAALARRSADAILLGEQVAAQASKYGLTMWAGMALGVTGQGLLESGDATAALGAFTRWRALTDASRAGFLGVLNRSAMAEALANTGNEGALAIAEAAEAHATSTGALLGLAEVQRRQGVVRHLLRPEDHAGAEVAYRRAIATARAQNAKLWELRAACDLARLFVLQGRSAEARALVAQLYDWFTEGFDAPDLVDATVLLAELS